MHNEEKKLQLLWDKISEHFATNKEVKCLAEEMRKLEEGVEISFSNVSRTAAGIVLKAVRHDIEKLEGFSVEIVPYLDKQGFPGVKEVSFNKLYLTPCKNGIKNYEWHKWIAVPNPKNAVGCPPYTWERLGYDKIDLSWVKCDFEHVNESIKNLERKLKMYTKSLGQMVLNKAIKPLNELKTYVVSDEYMNYIYDSMPRASLERDGFMTSGQYALLNALALWASQDYTQIGGGALNDDYVRNELKKVGVERPEVKKI